MTLRFIDIVRLIFILLVAFGLTLFLPITKPIGEIGMIPVMLIFSFLVVFLVNRAMERKRQLSISIAIERSRLRRIRHLTEKFASKKWRKDIYKALVSYQKKVADNFLEYDAAGKEFRGVTHLIYGFKPRNNYEEVIMEDLLDSTRELALQRQYIGQHLNGKLLPSSWLVLFAVAFLMILNLLLNRDGNTYISSGLGISAILVAIDFLRQKNKLSRFEIEFFQSLYKENIEKTKG